MRILTLSMHVPDSRATIRIADDGTRILTENLKFVCNPFDEFAVEQAVRLKESRSDVQEVVATTAGGAAAAQALRTALAMGADRAVHVCDEALRTHDEIMIAELLAAAIRTEEVSFDLILCGKQTIDNDTGDLGPALAEFLDVPHVGAAIALEVAADGSSLRAQRRLDGLEESIESPLPALVTCEKGMVEPRFPSLPNLMKAKSKPLRTVALSDLAGGGAMTAGTRLLAVAPPPPRPPCTMLAGEPPAMAEELIRRLREEAKVI